MQEPKYIIYMLTNTINGKQYIGKTVQGFKARWYRHASNTKKGVNTHLYNAMRKYGLDCWNSEIIYVSFEKDDDHLYDVETQLITDYDTYISGYNATKGGRGTGSGEANHRYKKKISKEQLAALRTSNIGNKYALGYKHTEQQNRNKSKALRTSPLRRDNKSGVRGVRQQNNQWVATISAYKNTIYLGSYSNKNDAIIARLMAELDHWDQIRVYT